MGGNVFKKPDGTALNRRYSKEEYFELIDELQFTFDVIFSKYNVCSALTEKTSFGDMDVLGIPAFELSVDSLKSFFDTEYCERNGGTYSLLYKEFQIDLIITNEKEYDFHLANHASSNN